VEDMITCCLHLSTDYRN